ncbi:uncharacterized protein GGS25DRAFT_507683 [Hypoxylon fragiforme]|uniref:uncharacterized protein n=1 Tax=Hypoxylon fragiforme TaxID=63214 RepID=UPI0020C6C810|nr:uncharacterized protein GGS25DRAFT_507683 [Hypoxylon fragiforme]KAI2604302.1 hypothetical protein GGS25DRAFT_507683 [Hypoxylon fragiforme]
MNAAPWHLPYMVNLWCLATAFALLTPDPNTPQSRGAEEAEGNTSLKIGMCYFAELCRDNFEVQYCLGVFLFFL